MRLQDFISPAILVFRTNPLPTGIGINSIHESVWHGIPRVPEKHRFAQPTRLVTPTFRALRVKIKQARILGVGARRSRVLRAGSSIRGKDIPVVIRSRTPSTRT